MRLSISEILKRASEAGTVASRQKFLLQHDSSALQIVVKHCFDPKIIFALPEGPAPFKPSEVDNLYGRLYGEVRKFYLFTQGGHPQLSQLRREQLFLDLLESIDAQDAALLVSIKDKQMPYKGITRSLITKTWPGLIDNA